MTQDDNVQVTEWDRECMAWHEAGHAVCAVMLPGHGRVERISIVPGDDAFGSMRTEVGRDHNATEQALMGMVATELAGVVCERMFLDRATTSGGQDLAAAYGLASDMVVRFGMGGHIGLACPGHSPDETRSQFIAGDSRRVAGDIRDIIFTAKGLTEKTLSRNKDKVKAVARALLRCGTLDGETFYREMQMKDTGNASVANDGKGSGIAGKIANALLWLLVALAVIGLFAYIIAQAISVSFKGA